MYGTLLPTNVLYFTELNKRFCGERFDVVSQIRARAHTQHIVIRQIRVRLGTSWIRNKRVNFVASNDSDTHSFTASIVIWSHRPPVLLFHKTGMSFSNYG